MQDDIIRMTREAGLYKILDEHAHEYGNGTAENTEYPELERFAALVAAHVAEKWKAENKRDYENWKMAAEKAAECEREACAKVCEELKWRSPPLNFAENCAAAIRARGDKCL